MPAIQPNPILALFSAAAHEKIRHVVADLETAAVPIMAGDEPWREFCDRVYAEMLAARRLTR